MRLALITTALLLPATLAAQGEFRWEQNAQLKVRYLAHKKLRVTPTKVGSKDLHLRAKYEPTDPGDFVFGPHGTYSWEFYLYEFPKNGKVLTPGALIESKTGKDKDDTTGTSTSQPLVLARNFKEFITKKGKDPSNNKRKVLSAGKRKKKARGNRPAYEIWEYTDQHRGTSSLHWYRYAVVYDLPDSEVVLMLNFPNWKKKPQPKLIKRARRMCGSLLLLDDDQIVTAGSHAARDKYADTEFKKAELDKAKKELEGLKNWDYFTTPNYIVFYSWDPDKGPSKQAQSQKFAFSMAAPLEKCRELYVKDFPPHEKMSEAYSIFRVCDNRKEFQNYGGTSLGVVGWFNPGSKELVIFNDREHLYGNKDDTLRTTFHEGWHQYANLYHGKGVELHRWIGEGMGDYFGAFELVGGRSWKYKVSKGRFVSIRPQVARNTYVPLKEIVHWNKDKFYGAGVLKYYAQGYAMVDFLRRGKRMGKKTFNPAWEKIIPTYIDTIVETKDQKKAVAAAFEEVDWDALDSAFVMWVRKFMKK